MRSWCRRIWGREGRSCFPSGENTNAPFRPLRLGPQQSQHAGWDRDTIRPRGGTRGSRRRLRGGTLARRNRSDRGSRGWGVAFDGLSWPHYRGGKARSAWRPQEQRTHCRYWLAGTTPSARKPRAFPFSLPSERQGQTRLLLIETRDGRHGPRPPSSDRPKVNEADDLERPERPPSHRPKAVVGDVTVVARAITQQTTV